MYLLTEWEGRTGKYSYKWPRAKYFPVRHNPTQSISILSYGPDFSVIKGAKKLWNTNRNIVHRNNQGCTGFYSPAHVNPYGPHHMTFTEYFLKSWRTGKYLSYDNSTYLLMFMFKISNISLLLGGLAMGRLESNKNLITMTSVSSPLQAYFNILSFRNHHHTLF